MLLVKATKIKTKSLQKYSISAMLKKLLVE
jgi:hypothetical protein